MKRQRHVILASLVMIAVLLFSAGPVAADGPVTRYEGVVDIVGPPVDPPPPTEALPGDRLLFEDWVLSPSHYLASDPRVTGWATITINGILEPSGLWKIWGSVDWDLDDYADEDTWVGEYHGLMRSTEEGIHATVVGEYQGTGALLGQRMKIVQKNRGASITLSGSIFEHPGN
jgi:hypothetical protein